MVLVRGSGLRCDVGDPLDRHHGVPDRTGDEDAADVEAQLEEAERPLEPATRCITTVTLSGKRMVVEKGMLDRERLGG